ncbi:MAG: DUF501 domain-containing protein, partial [Acidimicrobiales bacterium]|nr:DUF501 domain-containing protein [Acidimicrobiales bacterium]
MVVRDRSGGPVVIRNSPLLHDGTPMPTLYWLVGRAEKLAVDRLEAGGGVRRAEREIDPADVARAHAEYAAARDRALPDGWAGHLPAGGVAGARRGVKCLHAHYAWYLAGGDDPVGRWVAAELGETPAAAIDCGTNSTRLLVGRPGGPTLERVNRITRLGQGVDQTRRLHPDAIERTLAVLREYRSVMDRFGVDRVRMTATSAARDAINRDELFDGAEAIVGVRPELLGGDEEGALSFLGATSELDPAGGPWLVVDIGGGSTELVVGAAPAAPQAVRSLDVGCVRLTERFLDGDPPGPSSIAAARRYTSELLDRAAEEEPAFSAASTLVGLAGTVATLAALDQRIDTYEREKVHHYHLTSSRVDEMLGRLAAVPAGARGHIPGVEAGRADVIVGGIIVLSEVMRRFGFE